MRLTAGLVFATGYIITPVLAWGAAGHEITATIAQMHLLPDVLDRYCEFVYPGNGTCHLAPIATWADRIRGFPHYRWAAPFHYVGGNHDWPPSQCNFGNDGWKGREGVNVLAGIWNTTQWVREPRPGSEEAAKFLIHFLGDMHMPLHLTDRDRGGNDDKVHFHHRLTNLHSVWDSRLISNGILDTPRNYTRPLPSRQIENALRGTIYDPYLRQIVYEGLLGTWREEIQEWISCPSAPVQHMPNSDQVPLSGTLNGPDLGRWDDEFVCPYAWAKPIQDLNCNSMIWPKEFDIPPHLNPRPVYPELDTPEYAGEIRKSRMLEKLLAQAGIRIALVLNGLFASEEELTTRGRLNIPSLELEY